MRRVVVTGMGMVTPLACGVEATWSRLVAGQSAGDGILILGSKSLTEHEGGTSDRQQPASQELPGKER